jgi:lipoprotein-releasing system permease protein
MFQLWLTSRLLLRGRVLNLTTFLSFLGIVLGVGTLVVTMAVISGVETLMRTAVIDVSGHLMLSKQGGEVAPQQSLIPKVKEILPDAKAISPFVRLEAVIAKNGRVQGVIVEGLDTSTVDTVLNLKSRIIEGEYNVNPHQGQDQILIGKELAKNYQLKVGDELSLVVPRPPKTDSTSFQPTRSSFRISGVLDLGKYEYNERTVVVNDLAAQNLAGIGNVYSGVRILLNDIEGTRDAGMALVKKLDGSYWVRDWFEANYNFFSAVANEKRVIFFVILFMVLVASFNVSSTLFVGVLRRYRDVSLLKTMGTKSGFLVRMFVLQGMVLAFIGTIVGLILGVGVAKWVSVARLVDIPADVYKFDHLPVEFRFEDIAAVLVCTFLVCFLSTLIPAWRGAALSPIEGLRYE